MLDGGLVTVWNFCDEKASLPCVVEHILVAISNDVNQCQVSSQKAIRTDIASNTLVGKAGV